MSSERRRLLMGTSWTLASTLVALVSGTILNPVLVLYLGLGGFGTWALAVALASIFGLAGDLGVAAALTKNVAERHGMQRGIESLGSSALLFGLAAGGVAGVALFATSFLMAGYVNSADFPALLRLQALQMPFNLGSASLLGLLQGGRRFRVLSIFTMLQSLGSVALVAAALAAGGGIVGAMAASVAATAIGFIFLCQSRRADLHFGGASALGADFRQLVPFGVQLTATNALSTVLYQADLVLLSVLTGDARIVGIYALAVFSTRILWIIPGSISVTTYPVVSEYAAAADSSRMDRYMSAALLASLTVVGSLGSAFLLFGRPLLRLFFGVDSVGAYDLAIPMLFGTAVLGALRSIAPSLTSVGRPDIGLRISSLGAGVLVVLAFALTRAYGAFGTAFAVSGSFLVVSIALVASIERYVVRPVGGRLRSKHLGITAASACGVAVASALLALPAEPGLSNVAWAIALWTGLILVLIVASGGRKTWGGILRGAASAPETVP